jgi:chromate transporter
VSELALLGWTFLWLSFISVGGGLGTLAEMERQVVSVHRWVGAREFVDGYTLAQLTPGPTMLVAVFVGYRAHGLAGALVAGVAMFLPASLLAALAARGWHALRERPWARALERSLAPVGLGLMAAGALTLARTALTDGWTAGLAAAAALLLLPGRVPPVLVVLAAGLAATLG